MQNEKVLVEASHLVKEFTTTQFFGKSKNNIVHAVSDISLKINEGETFALVGESGCGKSTLGRMLLRMIEPTSGSVKFDGVDLVSQKKKQDFTKKMQFIFQDPYASLDPHMNVFDIIAEPLTTHKICKNREDLKGKVFSLMNTVGLRTEYRNRYPHQFSGGQRQRIGIARALALNPQFIVCDEPVSALDVSIQSQILNLLKLLQKKNNLTYLFISHDLGVVHYIADRVCVMFLGKVCEIGRTQDIYSHPLHPYTKFLIDAVPDIDLSKRDKEKPLLEGEIPSPVNPPSGCRFRTRCPYAKKRCAEEEPELQNIEDRQFACFFPECFKNGAE